jgi:hypothetical protein
MSCKNERKQKNVTYIDESGHEHCKVRNTSGEEGL